METQAMAGASMLANALTQQQEFGAQLIQGTMDNLNTDQVTGRIDSNYDFQTKVLAAGGIGRNLNLTV